LPHPVLTLNDNATALTSKVYTYSIHHIQDITQCEFIYIGPLVCIRKSTTGAYDKIGKTEDAHRISVGQSPAIPCFPDNNFFHIKFYLSKLAKTVVVVITIIIICAACVDLIYTIFKV
jgi:hypothetical protein